MLFVVVNFHRWILTNITRSVNSLFSPGGGGGGGYFYGAALDDGNQLIFQCSMDCAQSPAGASSWLSCFSFPILRGGEISFQFDQLLAFSVVRFLHDEFSSAEFLEYPIAK